MGKMITLRKTVGVLLFAVTLLAGLASFVSMGQVLGEAVAQAYVTPVVGADAQE